MRNDTRIVHAGRHPERHNGAVNPPVYHVSTVLHPSVAAMHAAEKGLPGVMSYGRSGTPNQLCL